MDEFDGPFRGWSGADALAHPDSPAGGCGPGAARRPGALAAAAYARATAHPHSPAARSAGMPVFRQRTIPEAAVGALRAAPDVEDLIAARTASLRDRLPDAFLREHFEQHAGYVGLRHRRRQSLGHHGGTQALADRLHDLVAWIDPPHFARLGDRSSKRSVLDARGGIGGSAASVRAAVGTLVEDVFARAGERVEQRSAAAEAGGGRATRALLYEWRRRLDLYASALRAHAGLETVKVSEAFTPRQLAPPPPEKTWVEFQLVDQHGKPVPDVAYEVLLPGGGRRTGRLNKKGELRFDGIDPGQCQIRFPEIDGREWRPA